MLSTTVTPAVYGPVADPKWAWPPSPNRALSPRSIEPFAAIHDRIWQLRHILTAYDAAYAAAAEHLQAPLLTSDGALATHPDLRCTVTDPRHYGR